MQAFLPLFLFVFIPHAAIVEEYRENSESYGLHCAIKLPECLSIFEAFRKSFSDSPQKLFCQSLYFSRNFITALSFPVGDKLIEGIN